MTVEDEILRSLSERIEKANVMLWILQQDLQTKKMSADEIVDRIQEARDEMKCDKEESCPKKS